MQRNGTRLRLPAAAMPTDRRALRRLGRDHAGPARRRGHPGAPRPAAPGPKASGGRSGGRDRDRPPAGSLAPEDGAPPAGDHGPGRPTRLPARACADPSPRPLSARGPFPMIQDTLKQLRLSGLGQTLSLRLQEAAANRLTHQEFLELILQDELSTRQQRQLDRRTCAAEFRALKSLEDFDWRFNPAISRKEIYELAAGHFIAQGTDVLFVGPPGV